MQFCFLPCKEQPPIPLIAVDSASMVAKRHLVFRHFQSGTCLNAGWATRCWNVVELACKVSECVCEEPGGYSAGGLHAVVASYVKSTHELWGATMQSLSVRAHLHDDCAFLTLSFYACSRFNLPRWDACCQCRANLRSLLAQVVQAFRTSLHCRSCK